MVPPEDKQKDAGQFNAWLTNLAPKPVARPGAPGQAPAARTPIGKPAGMPSAGGLLGAGLDDELDDIFGKIVTDDASAAAPPAMPKSGPPMAPPPQQPAPRAPATPAFNVPQQPRPGPLDIPARAQGAPAQPMSIFGQPMALPSAEPPARPVETKDPSFAESSDADMRQVLEQIQLRHQSDIQNAVNKTRSEFQTQMYQLQQRYQSDIQKAITQGKTEVQTKVQEIQVKYQEQRHKWEKVLTDLRSRNEELTLRNHELEEQLSQLRERQRMLIQEYTGMSASANSPVDSSAPKPTGSGPGLEIIYPPDNGQAPASISEIKIELPEVLKADSAADKEIRVRNESTLGEADDLLAELDALENEMKNLGDGS